jgi:regulatory protein
MSGKQHKIPEWTYNKITHYCAYQERCEEEVKVKLKSFGVKEDLQDTIIAELIKDNYLNEQRFASMFTSGKFRIKKWGKSKIYRALQEKKVPELFILDALNEIDDLEYCQTLGQLLKKKNAEIKDEDLKKRNRKLINFAHSKGYEAPAIRKVMNSEDYCL